MSNSLYNIKALWGRHKEIIRLNALGKYSNVEIAAMLGISRQTVHNALQSELGVEARNELQERMDSDVVQIQKRLQELTPDAVNAYSEILRGEGIPLTLKKVTADAVFDRAGHPKVTKETNVTEIGIFEVNLNDLKARASEFNNKRTKNYNEVKEFQHEEVDFVDSE